MAIQIVDNFQVNIAESIDNRLVVGPSQFYTDRDSLPYKYAGMRIWDLNEGVSGVPYVWSGTTFSTESSSGIAGSGTPGNVPKFIGGGNVLDDSIISNDFFSRIVCVPCNVDLNTKDIELIFNIALVIFLLHFIYSKIKNYNTAVNFDTDLTSITAFNIFLKTLGFTYLNPHVYSDTVFFLGNFSKNFIISQKILFGIGASIASFLFFFLIGYLSKYLSKYAKSKKIWNIINISIIIFMSFLTLFIITKMIN